MLRLSTFKAASCPCPVVVIVNTRPLESLASVMKKTSKPYHHGNLREALLEAAIALIAEVGPMAFTLREVARRAGVSHNAPYRHFRDKEDLMTAVATEGYRELTVAMQEAGRKQARALDRLKYAGLAYIDFALRRPEHFAVMFDAPLSGPAHYESNQAAKESFTTLVGYVQGAQEACELAAGDTVEY